VNRARDAERLEAENAELRRRLEEAQETLDAIRSGAVDGFIVEDELGEHVYTLQTDDRPYRRLVESMKEGAVTLDLDGCILFSNDRFAELVQAPVERVVGERLENFVPDRHAEPYAAMLLDAATGTYRGELDLLRSDGSVIPVHWTASLLDPDGTPTICAIVSDLTEHNLYEELRRAQEQMTMDMRARIRAEQSLKDADRRKDEFLAILAHELRNPLAPARNAVDYLKLRSSMETDTTRSVEIIDRQVSQLSRLIDDLLDISRVTSGVLELRKQRVRLADVVDAAMVACRDEVTRRGHTLEVNLPANPVELEVDRDRLEQVLCNLILNAAKYTPDGGEIALTARKTDHMLEVAVRDNGIGIPQDKLAEIFELFSQVNRSFERQGGLGIGLTLVRQLVHLHGGTIEARSEGLGRGSEFVIRVPTVAGSAVCVAPRPNTSVARRILLADDNRDAVESLAVLLESSNHEVHTAFDGEGALAAAYEVRPEVALLDIGMPKMNGYEVAQQIRREPWGRAIYLVALTGWGQEADHESSREAGFDAHLVKPVGYEDLSGLLADFRRTTEHPGSISPAHLPPASPPA